jgi:glyoxylase I family protein
MDFPSITHIALTVSDLRVSVPWYTELFGSPPVVEQAEAAGFRSAIWLQPSFGLHQFPDPTRTVFDEHHTGMDHVAFGCADRDELVRWQTRLDELGITRGAIVDEWYGSALAFRDPENIALEFFCPAAPKR